MALNGAVYNVTHYMDYHPGGWDELVKGAGRDATDMFNEIHKWVNYQSLLEACLVGKLVGGPAPALLSPPPAGHRLTLTGTASCWSWCMATCCRTWLRLTTLPTSTTNS